MDNYKNKPESPSLPTSKHSSYSLAHSFLDANFMELSYISENGQLMNKTDMMSSSVMAPAEAPPRRQSTFKKGKKGPVDIKINFGAMAVQDIIYKFKDNSVRTTK
jgi:hypothetical protein